MLTCFLSFDNYFEKDKKEAKEIIGLIVLSIICTLPIINLIFGLIQIIIVCLNDTFRNDNENRKIFGEHILYLMINFIIGFFLPNIYIIEFSNDNKEKKGLLKNYIFACSLIICANPLFVGGIRLYKTKIIKSIFKKIKKRLRKKKIDRESSISLNIETTFEQFESSAVEKFVMNIYIAICFCLEKKIDEHQIKYEDLGEAAHNETIRHKISKKAISKQLQNGLLINDRLVKLREEFSISCVEFAPKIFRFLRKLDGISEESIVNSMLPMNNKTGINETEGRGGSFFVNSDDREFIIKTITYEEMELMRKILLNKMATYFHENNDSIIGRIYGVYKISMRTGIFEDDELYFILMKNVFGVFENNYILKFDMKGSELNREVNTDKINNLKKCVLKDTNFIKMEHALLLSKENLKKLRNITQKDSSFLLDCKVMDYSLLVIKLEMNNDEMISLFSNEHMKNTLENINMYNDDSKDKIIKVNKQIKFNENNIKFPYADIENVKKYIFPSLDIKYFYIICIIDYFQLYDFQKYLETQIKRVKTEREKISSVPPKEYKERFDFFIQKITSPENIKEQLEKLNII